MKAISTVYFLRVWRLAFEATRDLVSPQWATSEVGEEMIKRFKPVQEEPKLGDIFVYRMFKTPEPGKSADEKNEGIAGHMGIFMGKSGKNIVAISDSRDMPKLEGYGIQIVDAEETAERKMMYFRCK